MKADIDSPTASERPTTDLRCFEFSHTEHAANRGQEYPGGTAKPEDQTFVDSERSSERLRDDILAND